MKKHLNLILLVSIILIVIVGVVFIRYRLGKENIQTRKFYQININLLDASKTATLEAQNLKVTLKGVYDNENLSKDTLISDLNLEPDNNILNNIIEAQNEETIDFIFEFCGQNDSFITELDFGYMIYDNNGNIFAYSMPYFYDNPEFLNYLINTNKYKNSYEITQHFATSKSEQVWSISGSDNRFLKCISINPLSDNLDLSKLHILIVDPKYKDINSNQEHSMNNTVFEFIIEK